MPRASRRRLLVLLAVAAAGCAAPPRRVGAGRASPDAFELRGRLGVRQGNDGFSGGIFWRHIRGADYVELLNPLGAVQARLRRDAQGALLETADGELRREADAAALSRAILGWELPLEALRHWSFGQTAPGSAAQVERDAAGRPTRLLQEGWEVRYPAWDEASGVPRRIELEKPGIRVRLAVASLAEAVP
ncbi:MAG: lipoprotein insertase outer membrane protein LolB [Betaproteobacteria bacterium]